MSTHSFSVSKQHIKHHVIIPSHSAGEEVIVRSYLLILINLQRTNIGTDTDIISVSVEHYTEDYWSTVAECEQGQNSLHIVAHPDSQNVLHMRVFSVLKFTTHHSVITTIALDTAADTSLGWAISQCSAILWVVVKGVHFCRLYIHDWS